MTRETQHTPGPWRVNAIKDNRIVGDETAVEYDKLRINNSNCTVATVYRGKDTRLIAAAPDLYDALCEARRVLQERLDALEPVRSATWLRCREVLDAIDAALAKVEPNNEEVAT